jgi:CheY-like chemotaxis protein
MADVGSASGTDAARTTPAVGLGDGGSLLGRRILVVDDDEALGRLATIVLELQGAQVTSADNGKAALTLVRDAMSRDDRGENTPPFDVILMDMKMPVMDGYEATNRLREEGYTGYVLAWTTGAMDGDREKCIAAGCDDYLSKPTTLAVLVGSIQRILDRSLHRR